MSKKVFKRVFTKKGDNDHIVPLSPHAIESVPGSQGDNETSATSGGTSQLTETSATERQAEETLLEAQSQRDKLLSDLEVELAQARQKHEDQLAQTTKQHEQEMTERRSALERDLRGELENEFRERYEQAIRSLENAAADLGTKRDDYLRQIERPALELIMETARQVLGQEIRENSSNLGQLIVRAMEMLRPEEVVNVHVHPATFHLLLENESFNTGLSQAGFSHKLVELDIDDTLDPDQFKAELGGMRIEYNLQSSISELLEILSKELKLSNSGDTG